MKYRKSAFTCQRDALTIRGFEFLPKVPDSSGAGLSAVIISHGFMSDHRETDTYARYFAEKGYAAYTFDFCGGGPKSSSDGLSTDMSVRTEILDLKSVIHYVKTRPYIKSGEISLMGCSQGGLVSAVAAGELPDEIQRLILFYPAFCIPDDARTGRLQGTSYDPVNPPETITVRKMKIGRIYPLDARNINVYEEILPFRGPVLILHGTADPVVNIGYSRQAWLTYTEDRPPAWTEESLVPGEVPGTSQVEKCPSGGPDEFLPLPALSPGVNPRADRQLMQISGGVHGFLLDRRNHPKSLTALDEFLKGYTEVLTIDVQLTGREQQTRGLRTHLELPFTGCGNSPWFQGAICPGAKDVQEIFWIRAQSKRADYTLEGHDYTGAPCRVHIINEGAGTAWKPTVTTDSPALAFLNSADCDALVEPRRSGPLVRIYARVQTW